MAFINENEKFCTKCGTAFEIRDMEFEGKVQYCPKCQQWHFPIFNTACIMIVVNPVDKKILLIKQYGRPDYILVSGYVNRGEDAENTVVREIKEETGLNVRSLKFNRSSYLEKSNSLMLNYIAFVDNPNELKPNNEIDSYQWFSYQDALNNIKPNSLAEKFLKEFVNSQK